MSTRCQVKIEGYKAIDKNHIGNPGVTLYHHTDGYPTNMLPTMYEGYKKQLDIFKKKGYESGKEFYFETPEKVASIVISSDPTVFEQEKSNALHGDIEWYYVIHPNGGKPWTVDVYKIHGWGNQKPIPVIKGVLLEKAAAEAEKIEEYGRKIGDKAHEEEKRLKA